MTFEVGVNAAFHASHALRGDFGPATRPHEHDYRVEVAVRGERLRDDGTLLDITLLDRAVRDALHELDGTSLDAIPAFRDRNSTAEEVARYLSARVAGSLTRDGLARISVRVWESAGAYAACERELS
jgi:6-pyruvoyltetrahydropterin/6-carboxytetrahydropterin synthase